MYWGMGQIILKAARFVEKTSPIVRGLYHQFFLRPGFFSDFLFPSIMGRKPSLTLELDSHTADAGLETRIEVVSGYCAPVPGNPVKTGDCRATPRYPAFQPATTFMRNGTPAVTTSAGDILPMTDPRVHPANPFHGADFHP